MRSPLSTTILFSMGPVTVSETVVVTWGIMAALADAALGLIVFFAILYFGVRARGLRGYLATFAEPSIVMVPLNVVETFTRTFSMIVRLFGNIMSAVFVIGIILSLAGLLVPIPLMALHLLVGAIQAYIFAVLAIVFIGSGVSEGGRRKSKERN
ncbi:MAG: F0F1 ATP synthase subunit A [Pseudolabrys sp.]